MRKRHSSTVLLLAVCLFLPWSTWTAVSEAQTAGGYKAPRTPWGDPDIQGTYSNAFEANTPMERPAEFEGRSHEDLSADELRAFRRKRHEMSLIGVAGGLHAPDHFWQEYYDLEKGARAWFIVDPPDGKLPLRVKEAEVRAATRAGARRGRGNADSWEDRSLYDRCITRGLPGSMMPAFYGNSYDITQAPGHVVIRYEMVNEARVIPLDRRDHVGSRVRSYMGDPRGHWEGETLVVETTNFNGKVAYMGTSDQLKITERFTPITPDKVRWSITFDDPSTWTRPWTFSMPLTRDESQDVFEYSCHEGNYAMFNILSAARAEEKLVEEYAKKGFKIRLREIPTEAEGEPQQERPATRPQP
jgi:hypothetical protein